MLAIFSNLFKFWTSNFKSAQTPPVINCYRISKLQVFKISPNFVKNSYFEEHFVFFKSENGQIAK